LEIAALDDGTVVEVAVIDVVDGIAKDLTLVGGVENGGVDFGERGGRDDQEFVSEVVGGKQFGEPGEFVIVGALGESGVESGRDDGDLCAGFEE
jgi:hypothetical protein